MVLLIFLCSKGLTPTRYNLQLVIVGKCTLYLLASLLETLKVQASNDTLHTVATFTIVLPVIYLCMS